MSHPATALRRSSVSAPAEPVSDSHDETTAAADAWLAVVAEKARSMRYGVVQIVVHDSRVVQIERTERTRFDVPPSTGHR